MVPSNEVHRDQVRISVVAHRGERNLAGVLQERGSLVRRQLDLFAAVHFV
jgi:hypothetical protein